MNTTITRSRWAAIGAAVAVTLGAGGIGLVSATSPADAVAYVPITPCRVADTRPQAQFNTGPRNTPIAQNETHTITAHGNNGDCTGIPTTATGVQLNVTALNATTGTFLTIWGNGAKPDASSLNPGPGQPPAPNAVTTGLTGAGVFNVYNAFGSVDVIVDIVGYYTDHNHDDRYYTEAEVNTALGTKANSADVYTKAEVNSVVDGSSVIGLPDAMAYVNNDGTLRANSGNIANVTYNAGLSRYEITFTNVSFFIGADIAQVTATGGTDAIASYDSVSNKLLVTMTDASTGVKIQAPFAFVVWDAG